MSKKYHVVITDNETWKTTRDENSSLFLYVGDTGEAIGATVAVNKVSSLELANLIAHVEMIVQKVKKDHPIIVPLIQPLIEGLKTEADA